MTTNAHENAAKALNEATAALHAGIDANGRADTIRASEAPSLAYDLAHHLDALVALMHSVDLEPAPATAAEQTLEGVARHIHDAAGLAHDLGQRHRAHQRPIYGQRPGGTFDR